MLGKRHFITASSDKRTYFNYWYATGTNCEAPIFPPSFCSAALTLPSAACIFELPHAGRLLIPQPCRRHGYSHHRRSEGAHRVRLDPHSSPIGHTMLTLTCRSLPADEIPIKLRCANCSKLAFNAFRLPCCEQAICETCTMLRDFLPSFDSVTDRKRSRPV
jgi:hypothetical protein